MKDICRELVSAGYNLWISQTSSSELPAKRMHSLPEKPPWNLIWISFTSVNFPVSMKTNCCKPYVWPAQRMQRNTASSHSCRLYLVWIPAGFFVAIKHVIFSEFLYIPIEDRAHPKVARAFSLPFSKMRLTLHTWFSYADPQCWSMGSWNRRTGRVFKNIFLCH